MSFPGRFVGVGVGSYLDAAYDDLPRATKDVEDLSAALDAELGDEPILDGTGAEVRSRLESLEPVTDGGPLVLLWSGHAVPSSGGDGLRLLTHDSDAMQSASFGVDDLARACARSGAGQVLIILDTCWAGQGSASAVEFTRRMLDAHGAETERLWVGVIAACQPWETARDGYLASRLLELLQKGPKGADQQRRWSKHNRMIQGEDLGAALLEEWKGEPQPSFRRDGRAWLMFTNPLYDENEPEQVVEHLLLAARSGAREDEPSLFTGRRAEVDLLVSWVRSKTPGVRVITGSAGTGKSAIVGRVVSLSNPTERQRLAKHESAWGHDDPGEQSITAHVHARGRTPDQLAELLDQQLVARGVLTADDTGRRNAAQLVGTLQKQASTGVLPVVVVDGLDEARGNAFAVARDLLARLAPYAVVVTSTRDLPEPGDSDATLVSALGPVEVIDIDDEQWVASGRAAVRDYVTRRLRDVHPRMSADAIADHVSGTVDQCSEQPFLLTRLIVDQLLADPIDTSADGWNLLISASMDDAFNADLAKAPPPGHRTLPDGISAPTFARCLLAALTYAFGGGFPEDEWRVAAAALLADADVGPVSASDISWVLEHLGRYVVQDGEAGVAVYRMAHQSLADRLQPAFTPTTEQLFDANAGAIANALLSRYDGLLRSGVPTAAPNYLWLYAWQHASSGGLLTLAQLREMAVLDESLRADVASAALPIAETLAGWGRKQEAVAPTEEAVEIYGALAEQNPAYLPNLAIALNNLGNRYADVGRHSNALAATEQAVALRRRLAAQNPGYLPNLAIALNNLGNRYAKVGDHYKALAATEQAVALRRTFAEQNPGYLPDLAAALTNLGSRYADIDRHSDAVAPTKAAVDTYGPLAEQNPAYIPNLATALNNLGNHYSDIGRHSEALAATEAAAALRGALAEQNPGYLPDLAATLSNLGLHYAEVGRRGDALAPTELAVDTYRAAAADNPGYLADLATALDSLGSRYADVARHGDALAPSKEAVDIFRTLAEQNRSYLPKLAAALNNLGIRYADAGRMGDALAPAEEAVALRRTQVQQNRSYLPNLAAALNNLGIRYAEAGRMGDALTLTVEAVALRRTQAEQNRRYLPDLAGALDNLGIRYAEIGRHDKALAVTEEAVDIYSPLAEQNPGNLPDLAMALNNLGRRFADIGDHDKALAATEEAVETYRPLAAQSARYLPDLASALNDLGRRYADIGDHDKALTTTEQAVGLRRTFAVQNRGYLPDLAAALNSLGIYFAQAGRQIEALVPTKEALDIYRALAAENYGYLPDLAGTLNNLGSRYAEVGQPSDIDTVWSDILATFPPITTPVLLLHRALAAPDGSVAAVGWLVEVTQSGSADVGIVLDARREARRRRDSDSLAFDEQWRDISRVERPAWLGVPQLLVDEAAAWITTATYGEEFEYLLAHPRVIAPETDEAVAEVALVLDAESLSRYENLRAVARREGIGAAYRPQLLVILSTEFARSAPQEQRILLEQRHADLTDELVVDFLTRQNGDNTTAESLRALALVRLAGEPAPAGVLDATLDALEEPFLFGPMLARIARTAPPEILTLISWTALSAASTNADYGRALFYLAVAQALSGDMEAAEGTARDACASAPESHTTWIKEVVDIGRQRPAVLDLVSTILAAATDQPANESPANTGQNDSE